MSSVRPERTGWRDEALSRLHRLWGMDCPMLDLDFLAVEYDHGRAVALVEYKHEMAKLQLPSHPSYKALAGLGTDAGRPVFAVRYAADFSWWRVMPLNAAAKVWVPERREMTQREWVGILYAIRGRELPMSVFANYGREEVSHQTWNA